MNFNDLVKVKLGHGQMGSISYFVHGYRIFTPFKTHTNTIIPWFFMFYHYMITFDDLSKVKEGQSQKGSISGLIYDSKNKYPCKLHESHINRRQCYTTVASTKSF